MKPLQIPFTTLLLTASIAAPSVAQITPDTSLPSGEQSIINVDGDRTQIQGGAQRGGNLFHSFEAFSIQQGGTAWFDNAIDIQNIFSRITGPGASMIDGVLGANGSANLFFLNPNGILFGPNARLNIGGSFVAATANRVDFDDGLSWGLDSQPLLTIARPIGLEIGPSAGPIQVVDSGNTFVSLTPLATNVAPIVEANPSPGLDMSPGQTIALIGPFIQLDGGLLRAPDGQVELIGVRAGSISILPNEADGLDLKSQDNILSGEVLLTSRSTLDVTGAHGGLVELTGSLIRIEDGSVVMTGGLIDANPSRSGIQITGETLSVDGTLPKYDNSLNPSDPVIPQFGSISSQSAAVTGGLGPIAINVDNLILENGGAIFSHALSGSEPSDIEINAQDILISGFSPNMPIVFSNISSTTSLQSTASGADITVIADQMRIEDLGIILSTTTSQANAGQIYVIGNDILIRSQVPANTQPAFTGVLTTSFRLLDSAENGRGGDIFVDTETLNIRSQEGQAGIVSTTLNSADSGNVTVTATESVNIIGGSGANTGIASSVTNADTVAETIPSIGGELAEGSRGAGRIFLQSPKIVIRRLIEGEGSVGISVSNESVGSAGDVIINGELLINAGDIVAFTTGGDGGNIFIDVDQVILRGGEISANSRGQGIGGNVDVQADFLALLDGASITANAVDDRGGRVFIQANAFLQSTDSVITATSALGPEFDGEVILEVPRENPVAIIPFPTPAIEFPETIATCAGGRFAVTGRGGFPLSPDSYFTGNRGWNPPPDNSQSNLIDVTETHESSDVLPPRAQAMVVRPDGLVDLVAYAEAPPSTALLDCAQLP